MASGMDLLQKQQLDDVFDAFSMLVQGTYVSLMHVQGGFTRYTASAVELFQLPGEYIPNGAMDWNDYLHPEDRKRYMDVMIPLLEGKTRTYDITYRVRTKGGGYTNFRAVGAVLRGSDGKPSLIGGAMFNEGVANTVDHVTVLPNKTAFLEQLTRRLEQGKSAVVMQAGFRGLSNINRVHGYTYGNRVLQEVAWLIQETVQGRCEVFRLEDAKFLLLADKLSKEQMSAIYDQLRYRLQRGIEINGIRNSLHVSGSMLTVFGVDLDAASALICLRSAYEESVQHAHGELVDFNGSVNYEGHRSLELINTIRNCVQDDCKGFFLEYHPVIDAAAGKWNGAEGVIAWRSQAGASIPSEDILPILTEDYVFEALGEAMLRRGLEEGVSLLEQDPSYLLCLNVYRIQLESDFFVEDLLMDLEETGFPAAQLSLKLDAECRSIEPKRLNELVERLHALKILVIIDGFGSGRDSIEFLKNLPVDAVSMDPHFLEGITENKRDRDILEHLTKMAATCVPHINIKGVKNREQRDILAEFPITTMQGELFCRPLSFAQLKEHYKAGK